MKRLSGGYNKRKGIKPDGRKWGSGMDEKAAGRERVLRANELFVKAARADGLRGLIEGAGQVFGCPVLLVDECFRLIASTAPGYGGDPRWEQLQRRQRLDEERMWQLLRENAPEDTPFYPPFYAERGLCREQPMLLGELVRDGAVLGHLLVCLGNTPLQEGDLELMDTLLYLLVLHLDQRPRGMEHWTRAMATRLQTLLLEDSPPHLTRLAAEALAENFKGRYAVLVTPVGGQAAQRAFADFAVLQLQQSWRSVAALVFESAIVTLISEVRYSRVHPILRPDNNELVERLFRFFQAYDLKPGLSSSFQDLLQLRQHYRQALLSARLANSLDLGRPAVFIDLMPLPLFSAALEAEPNRTFLHPVMPRIRAYDREHGTEYEKTLRTYALCMRAREETAARLNIHKNTLKYRLERIVELFDLPVEDSWTALNLLCSALLLELRPELGELPAAGQTGAGQVLACSEGLMGAAQ